MPPINICVNLRWKKTGKEVIGSEPTYMNICLYGSARDAIGEEFLAEGEKLGELMAGHGHSLVFGAGATGMMGAVSRGVIKCDGVTIGVSPYFMEEYEPLACCTGVIRTDTMHERKSVMEDMADLFVIAPGGIGTLDEFFSILTLKQLERHNKPILIWNINGFYDPLIALLEAMQARHGLADEVLYLYRVVADKSEIVEAADSCEMQTEKHVSCSS